MPNWYVQRSKAKSCIEMRRRPDEVQTKATEHNCSGQDLYEVEMAGEKNFLWEQVSE